MTQHDLVLVSADASPTAGQLDRAVAAYLTRFTGSSRGHARSDLRCFLAWSASNWLGMLSMTGAWIRWPHGGRTWSSTSGGCRRSGASSRPRSRAGSPSSRASTGPLSLTACWTTRPPSMSGVQPCHPSRPPSASRTCSSRPCSPPAANQPAHPTSPSSRCSGCSACASSKPPAPTSPTWARSTAIACSGCAAKEPRSSSRNPSTPRTASM